MKKLLFALLAAVLVLSTINSSALADDDIISAIIEGRIICYEYSGIISEPIIPRNYKKEVISVGPGQELMLYPGTYWLARKEKKFPILIIIVSGLTLFPLEPGDYVLRTKPPVTP